MDVVTLEALSHFVVEVLFISYFATLSLDKLVLLSDRTRLESLLNRSKLKFSHHSTQSS